MRLHRVVLLGLGLMLTAALSLSVMAVVWWLGIHLLGLPEQALLVLPVAVGFLASAAGAAGLWAAYRLVDLTAVRLKVRSSDTENKIDHVLAPLIPRTLKVFVIVVGVVFITDNLNIDITGLIAGLGLGGLAFALAAKDMAQNLFASFTILLDRTVIVGDWVKVGDQEGSVERIGFRSTSDPHLLQIGAHRAELASRRAATDFKRTRARVGSGGLKLARQRPLQGAIANEHLNEPKNTAGGDRAVIGRVSGMSIRSKRRGLAIDATMTQIDACVSAPTNGPVNSAFGSG